MIEPERSGADGTSAPIDLSGVDPVHWEETRERIAILRAWCEGGRHTRRDAEAAADRMGLGVNHFYRLATAWRKHRDVVRVSGHPARRGDERGPRSIPSTARGILRQVVDKRGGGARFVDVLAEVRSACAAAGVAAPSSGMVHREIMRARQSGATGAGGAPDDIAVAAVVCLLPVTTGAATIAAPELVLAVERPGGVVVDHRLVLDGDPIAAARAVLAGLSERGSVPIMVAAPLSDAVGRDGAGDPPSAGARVPRIEVATRSTLLSTTLGSYLDSIPIRHRRSTSGRGGPWRPLSPADAVAAVDLAVAAHNAARRG